MPDANFGPVMGMVCGGLFALVGVAVAGLLLWLAQKAANNAAVVKNTPVTAVEKLKAGLRKVKGKVVLTDDPVLSPMTKTECAFFHFQVLERRTRTVSTGGRHGGTRTETYWHPVVDDKEAADAVIEDDTGEVELDLLKAEMVLSESAHTQSGTFDDAPEHLKRTLSKKYGVSTKGLLFNKSMKYSETILCEGDKVVVVGTVTPGGKKDPPSIGPGKPHPFIVSDKSSSGTVKHFEQRALWMRIIGVVVGVLFLGAGGFAGFMAFQSSRVVNQAQAQFNAAGGNNPFPNNPGQPNNPLNGGGGGLGVMPKPEDPLDAALKDLKSSDYWARSRAADAIARMDPIPERKNEVVKAIRILKIDPLPGASKEQKDVIPQACQRALDRWEPKKK